jgi:uncharacterized small protein (DUF1192 family)
VIEQTEAERELARVSAFRNGLVAYMNIILPHADDFRWQVADPDVAHKVSSLQTGLAQEYGRLFEVINRYGGMMMSSPALGITSRDVIQDAIHDIGDSSYRDLARLSVQHLDTVIGRLAADAEREERERRAKRARRDEDPDRWYRLTSPIYWLHKLARLLRWLIGTVHGRMTVAIGLFVAAIVAGIVVGLAAAFGLLVAAVISGIVSGVAQAWFQRVTTER